VKNVVCTAIRTRPRIWLPYRASSCTAAFADEEVIRKVFKEKFPELTVEKVTKTPYSNLYEVFAQDQIVYTDEKASFLIMGRLVDIKSGQDVTAERRGDLTRVNFGDLPLNLAMKIVKGNGKRKVAIFSDHDCPYCNRLKRIWRRLPTSPSICSSIPSIRCTRMQLKKPERGVPPIK
jgi:thiol:disulfide interchange protein DsbC